MHGLQKNMGPEQLRTPGPPRYATRGISVRRYRRKDEEKGGNLVDVDAYARFAVEQG